ncbi:hypothetical protein EB796_014090 [Bugula neritina]|uniref:Uncharacterized protein n=1 Tax=Bugula neritina TaxID=10212 RepID=A0A7J7JNY6_BUGNE|nr:hypothetical protein EB796_014090 [Bugula neritina]
MGSWLHSPLKSDSNLCANQSLLIESLLIKPSQIPSGHIIQIDSTAKVVYNCFCQEKVYTLQYITSTSAATQ